MPGLISFVEASSARRPRRHGRRLYVLTALGLVAASPALAGAPIDVPWSAPTPKPISREITFQSGDARLSGTLYLPAGSEPRPVVIVYHSASDAVREAPLYRHLIAMLPPVGVGVFVFDRRGSGRSSGPAAEWFVRGTGR